MVIRKTPTSRDLKHIYRTIQQLIDNKQCYYTKEEIEQLKRDEKNIFLEMGNKN